MCFKNKLHAKYSAVRECHVILRDIFKCNVDVERLPEYVIDKANEGTIRVQPRDVTSNQHDHNYSKNYFVSVFILFIRHQTNRLKFIRFKIELFIFWIQLIFRRIHVMWSPIVRRFTH